MRRMITMLTVLVLMVSLAVPASAEDLASTQEPSQNGATQEQHGDLLPEENIPNAPAPVETVPIQEELGPMASAEPPVPDEVILEIDQEHRYPGMDKTYAEGYTAAVSENGLLRLIVPLLSLGKDQALLDITLEGLPLTQEECLQRLSPQTVALESGEVVEKVFLADYQIRLPESVPAGEYPVTLKISGGDLIQPMEIDIPRAILIPAKEEPAPPESGPDETDPEPSGPDGTELPTDPPTEPTTPKIPTVLEIDSQYLYDGMDMTYAEGYLPHIEGGVMSIVLPLRCTGALWDNKLDATISLESGPFVVENFRRTFNLETHWTGSGEEREAYLVTFDVLLSDSRQNGTYPVTITTSGFDASGNTITTTFTLYITITDGKVEKPVAPTVNTPTAEPVVYISKTVLEPQTAQAGEAFTMTVTLKNSITTKFVRNMLVTVDTGNVLIDLDEDSKIFPIDRIDGGGEVELTLHFSTEPAIPSGKYPINFSFKYDSSKTLNLSSSGSTVVEIQQPANMELVMPRFSDSVSVGETVPVSFQVMNMGRSAMYNVRCTVSGFGLVPSNTGYIGTMEAGTSKNTKVELYIIALNASAGNENGPQYGNTTGTVTLIYEDETGQEYSQEATFDTTVNRPVVELPQNVGEDEKEEKRASSWWVSVSILGGVILVVVGLLVFLKKGKCGGNYL